MAYTLSTMTDAIEFSEGLLTERVEDTKGGNSWHTPCQP